MTRIRSGVGRRNDRRSVEAYGPQDADGGSAVVEFVLVGGLVTVLFLAVLQVGVDLYVRNVLEACVADGAMYGADADVADAAAGAAHANREIATSLGARYAHAFAGRPASTTDGLAVVTVYARARLPLLAWFLPAGPQIRISGHALLERSG